MTTNVQYGCNRCGRKGFNQFEFTAYRIEGAYPMNGHLCEKCLNKVLEIVKAESR